MQISGVRPRAPLAVGIGVAGALGVGERRDVAGGDRLVLDRWIDLLQERQRDIVSEIKRGGRPIEDEARLRDIHVELFQHRPRRRIGTRGLGDGWLVIARIKRQEFFLRR